MSIEKITIETLQILIYISFESTFGVPVVRQHEQKGHHLQPLHPNHSQFRKSPLMSPTAKCG
jgi:hypothetical protein